jgi:hypothetical protein
MTNTIQSQRLSLALASIACVAAALWGLWRYDVFSAAEDVNIVVQPLVIRWIVAIVIGLAGPQFVLAGARSLGLGRFWSRLAAFARNVETMPQKVDDIHATVCVQMADWPSSVKEKT